MITIKSLKWSNWFSYGDNNFIDFKGRVKWQKEKIPDKLFLIGIKFEDIDKNNYKKLEKSLYEI